MPGYCNHVLFHKYVFVYILTANEPPSTMLPGWITHGYKDDID